MSWPKKRRLLPAVAVIGVVAGLLWLPRPSEQPAVYLTEHRSDAAVQLARQELLETIDDMLPDDGNGPVSVRFLRWMFVTSRHRNRFRSVAARVLVLARKKGLGTIVEL